jgi:hypothetical protein
MIVEATSLEATVSRAEPLWSSRCLALLIRNSWSSIENPNTTRADQAEAIVSKIKVRTGHEQEGCCGRPAASWSTRWSPLPASVARDCAVPLAIFGHA